MSFLLVSESKHSSRLSGTKYKLWSSWVFSTFTLLANSNDSIFSWQLNFYLFLYSYLVLVKIWTCISAKKKKKEEEEKRKKKGQQTTWYPASFFTWNKCLFEVWKTLGIYYMKQYRPHIPMWNKLTYREIYPNTHHFLYLGHHIARYRLKYTI